MLWDGVGSCLSTGSRWVFYPGQCVWQSLFQPQTLFLFSWTGFQLAHEKGLWGVPGFIACLTPSCDNGPRR